MNEKSAKAEAGLAAQKVGQTEEIEMTTKQEEKSRERSFDPSRYLRKLGGRDYLEVKWRLLWLRTEHPDATMETEMVRLDEGFALFRARVALPEGGEATGWGSETRQDFFDYIEKAETKALGRALAALGYGTQFCEDFDFAAGSAGNAHVVDSPVELNPAGGNDRAIPARPSAVPQSSGSLATPAQLKLIYLTATRDLQITEEELEERCQTQYGRLPLHLTKREASEFIDALKASGLARAQ